ncbi:membrane-associated protein, putative [Bodo saltans]|uniref:Membrane-associated protein, putative n=1 Tax=Bodo saltans TaxID=75058 RepID=A0A0S4IWD4_BODSA|nr:membrane-associated protein, putative [Bodo saltans]|eukprot:CUG27879.1 membrane-associated protein, putative [Bodo saltans]
MSGGGLWWSAAITPTAPVYGPYIANRKRIIIIVAIVCGGMAMVVLVLTYLVMRPLGVLMEEMIAALRLQTQTDRYRSVPLSDAAAVTGAASAVGCGAHHINVSELYEIEVAVHDLHLLLKEMAKMLPPPVILMIRRRLALRDLAPDDDNGGNSLTSSDERSNAVFAAPSRGELEAEFGDDENVAHMLAWFEDYYRSNPSYSNFPAIDEHHVVQQEGSRVTELFSVDAAAAASRQQLIAFDTTSTANASSIMLNPSVSLRPPRCRGYFVAVSLQEYRGEPAHFGRAVAPLFALVWQHGGEVEFIERGLLLATFGCYFHLTDAADRALACAIAMLHEGLNNSDSNVHHASPKKQRITVAIDCGWIETATLCCTLPSGLVIRRQVVSSIARDVAPRLLSLGSVLNEQLLVTGDALRRITPAALIGREPMLVDNLNFDALSWSGLTRRSTMFIFSIPVQENAATHNESSHPAAAALPRASDDARMVSDGFRLMMGAQYIEAEAYFREVCAVCLRNQWRPHRTILRMLALSNVFANILRHDPLSDVAPYFRGECTLFEAFDDERIVLC